MKSQVSARKVIIRIVLLSTLWLALPTTTTAQEPTYTAGEAYWGRNQYIEYIAGDLPIILAAPHGGYLEPSEVPDRTSGATGHDLKSQEYTRKVAGYITEMTCGAPHVIINHLARVKLDANRNKEEAAQGSRWAEQAWDEFHGYIDAAKASSIADFGYGHFFDLHTNDHSSQWVEVGFTLSSSQLKNSDDALDSANYKDKSSIRSLAYASDVYFPEMIRGATSLGGFLQGHGYKSVPSPAHPDPGGSAYFSGGYNTQTHGSSNGGSIDATQIETYYGFLKSNGLDTYTYALAESIVDFYESHYGVTLRQNECATPPGPEDDSIEPDLDPEVTYLSLEPAQTTIYPGNTVEVNVSVINADNLYGLQVVCTVDPALLAWQSAQFGDFFTEPLIGAKNMDAATGAWMGAISQKNPAPALSGGGSFATFTFTAVASGNATITCEPLGSDRDGAILPVSMLDAAITILDTSDFSGMIAGDVIFQGRTDHAGIEITAEGPLSTSSQSNSSGDFELVGLQDGDYEVTADTELHLPSCATTTLGSGQPVTLPPTTLAGGDTDDNGEIRINDATLIGSNFNLSASSTPAVDPRADINVDGEVNVFDLSILGGNFGKQGCQEWLANSTTATIPSGS